MRVMMVHHRGDIVTGGTEQILLRWLTDGPAAGVQTCVALPERGPLADALTAMGVPYRVIDVAWQARTDLGRSRYLAGLPGRVATLAAWIRAADIELVHTNTFNLLEGALAAHLTGRPHVWHVRSVFGTDPPPYALAGFELSTERQVRFLSMLGDRILSVSAAAAEPFMAGPLPVECIPNGIDLDDWKARGAGVAGAALRTELGLAHDTPIVANVARVSSEKDQVTFVEACAAIRAHRPDVHYAIIGETRTDAKAVREVRAAIATHQLGNRLHLLGERHDLPALYPQFDVMLLTSRHEGFANVLMEAMASGVPVVSTMSGGPQSIIRDQVDGLLVPVGDAAALADAAMLCLSEQETVQRMTDSALRRVKEEFDWPVIVRRITDFYRRTIAERHQVRGGHEHGLMVLLEIIAEAAQRDAARAKILERLCCGPSKGRMHRLGAAAMGALRRTVKLGKGLN